METTKLILAILLIAAFFVFLPQILSLTMSGLSHGGVFGASTSGTLVEPRDGQGGTLAVSYDGGESFVEAKVHTSFAPQILAIDQYQAFYIAGTDRGLLISRDEGHNWHPFTDLERQIDARTTIYGFTRGLGSSLYIAAVKNGHGVIYSTNDTFFTATSIWKEADMRALAINADTTYLYVGLEDGRLLRYSFVERTFEKVADFDRGVVDLVFTGDRSLFVGLGDGRVYTDSGTRLNFTAVEVPDNGRLVLKSGLHLTNDSRSPHSLFLASVSGIFRSDNQGSIWNEIDSILPTRANIAALIVQNGSIFLTSEAKFYKSNDSGKSWKVSEPMPTNQRFGALYVDNRGKTVIVGTKR